ncbi:hypothetical protein TI04_06750 [Achromatium sp. WMS2]|nr:hypothetical protein TI04_06750 [Achromatium sp. WMS2]
MKILALDTATEACSAALSLNNQVYARFTEAPRGHGELILGMIDELMQTAAATVTELDAVAFGRGPGSFTGVRIATAVAQAIGFGANLPLVPISNLALLAQGLYRTTGALKIAVALDARMGEIYWGAYHMVSGVAQAVADEQVLAPDQLVWNLTGGAWQGVGRGFTTYADVLIPRLDRSCNLSSANLLCNAQDLIPLAQAALTDSNTPLATATPIYLRNQVVHLKPHH